MLPTETVTVSLPQKPPPKTQTGKSQAQIAKELRSHAKYLAAKQPPPNIGNYIVALRSAIEKRSTKAHRLQILANLEQAVQDYTTNHNSYVTKVHELAQQLHTIEDLPDGRAENVLRAIKAILKTNGV